MRIQKTQKPSILYPYAIPKINTLTTFQIKKKLNLKTLINFLKITKLNL